MWVVIAVVALLCLLAWAGDWVYSARTEARYRKWDATIQRNEQGIRVEYGEVRQGDGRKAILFVHGFACPPSVFRHFIDYFSTHGYACVAIRLPGFGEQIEAASEVTQADWIEAVTREAKHLREGRNEVWIAAHSLGCAISLRALKEDPDLADGLVLLAPLFRVGQARSPLISPALWYHLFRPLFNKTRMLESIFPIDADDPVVREDPARELFVPLSIYDGLFGLLADVDLADPECPSIPVFLALAEHDLVVDPSAARTWFDGLEGGRRTLWESPEAGHVLPLDTGWEELLERVSDFMAGPSVH